MFSGAVQLQNLCSVLAFKYESAEFFVFFNIGERMQLRYHWQNETLLFVLSLSKRKPMSKTRIGVALNIENQFFKITLQRWIAKIITLTVKDTFSTKI